MSDANGSQIHRDEVHFNSIIGGSPWLLVRGLAGQAPAAVQCIRNRLAMQLGRQAGCVLDRLEVETSFQFESFI